MNNRILMIDDETEYLIHHASILEDEGYVVKRVRNLTEATQVLQNQEFCLVFLDLMMPPVKENQDPRRTGVIFYREMRTKMSLTVPVIFMSAVRDETIIQDLVDFEKKPIRFLRKPVAIHLFMDEVRKVLG